MSELNKHVVWFPDDDRREAIDVEVARVTGPEGSVPVVATTHRYCIRLMYWSPAAGRWQGLQLDHRGYRNLPYTGPLTDHLSQLSGTAWSARIGLVAGGDRIFLVFKRDLQPTGTWRRRIWVQSWRLTANGLEPDRPAPVEVPFEANLRAGFHLAAEYDAERDHLVVISQAYRETNPIPQLIAWKADDPGGSIDQPGAWVAVPLGTGGWDLDTRLSGGTLHCLYRERPYAVQMATPWPEAPEWPSIDRAFLDATELTYQPLHHLQLGSDLAVEAEANDLPGGVAPRIAHAAPFAYTCERWSAGELEFIVGPASFIRIINLNLTHRRAHVFWRLDGWREARLHAVEETVVQHHEMVRSGRWTLDDMILRLSGDAGMFDLTAVRTRTHLAATGFRTAPQVVELDLLRHDPALGALVLHRLALDPVLSPQDSSLDAFGVVDINHGRLPRPDDLTPKASGNDAFGKMRGQLEIVDIDPNGAFGVSVRYRTQQIIDHGAAHDLEVVEREEDTVDVVYVHSGDGGARGIFGTDLRTIPVVSSTTGTLDPTAVDGSAWADTEWTELTSPPATDPPTFGFVAFELPADHRADPVFPPRLPDGTRFTGLDEILHQLILFSFNATTIEPNSLWGDTMDDARRRVTVRRDHLDTLQAWLSWNGDSPGVVLDLATLPGTIKTVTVESEDDDSVATFRSPTDIFRTQETRLDASGSSLDGIDDDDLEYVWQIVGTDRNGNQVDDWNLTTDDPVALFTMSAPLSRWYRITLMVRSGTAELSVSRTVRATQPLWETLWSFHNGVNQQLRSVTGASGPGNMNATFSKYRIEWRVDAAWNPFEATIQLEDEYRGAYRFRGNPGGQGEVDLELPLEVELPNVQLDPGYQPSANISVDLRLAYGRAYSPALLSRDPRSDGRGPARESWTAKPVSDALAVITDVDVNFAWTIGGGIGWSVLAVVVELLVGLGLMWLAGLIGGLAAAAAVAAASIVGIIAALVIIGVTIGIVVGVVPGIVEGEIENNLRRRNFTPMLNRTGLLTDAGEGLAEALAAAVRDAAREPMGESRMEPGRWGMVYVTDESCRVLHATD